jgi:hypothetical protein
MFNPDNYINPNKPFLALPLPEKTPLRLAFCAARLSLHNPHLMMSTTYKSPQSFWSDEHGAEISPLLSLWAFERKDGTGWDIAHCHGTHLIADTTSRMFYNAFNNDRVFTVLNDAPLTAAQARGKIHEFNFKAKNASPETAPFLGLIR